MSAERGFPTLDEIITKGDDAEDPTYKAEWERFTYEDRKDGVESLTAFVYRNEEDKIVYIKPGRYHNLPEGEIPQEAIDAEEFTQEALDKGILQDPQES